MELVFQQCMSLYSTIQCLQPVHGQQDTFAEQKMHPSTQQNSGLKLSMNILRTLTSNTGFHTTRRSLRPLVGRPYSFREQYREKSIVFTPPLSRHRGFRFPAVQHTPCLFRLQSNASNLSMDLLRHFKTQWIPLRNKETAQGRSFEKVLILKQAHFLGSQCPDLISGGNLFGAIPATVPFIIQQGCVFNLSLDNRGPFQDNNAVF
ncbi:hypothetical protein TNCT_566731 [Trichonephila clavata]|uniref:Uncharacterized protein n=1 Tax=Trichonephila clavata TaxID=2740835 RepID=A0A8X6FGY1_TRICU|nr:hypothetical protein TNCT_379971 [Trichonephila clavata]GFQ91254.1 hypothetical protein TNCT_363461 [Trichonephila clavata]GFR29365.1 hypothetical protein TNCT_566601 [Trichonephila clavata]GFR29370.1 hypothetical protein TNCT_566621 [Trichonephila clavata]GFR29406.1 hypothetical protein TNCT_566731 [Trichonephila clavata]